MSKLLEDDLHRQVRVLFLTRNLPPLRGGMERLNKHMVIELADTYSVKIIGPVGSLSQLPATVSVKELPIRPLWLFLWRMLVSSLRSAFKEKPSVVLAGSGLTAPFAVLAARLTGGCCVIYAHGLDLVVKHRLYRAVWLPFLRRGDLCIVNSNNTARLAESIGVPGERIAIIHPGVVMPDDTRRGNGADFRMRHELIAKKLLLSVGRLTPRKGLLEFIQFAMPNIVKDNSNAVLVIVGDEAPDALKGSGIGITPRLRSCIQEHGLDKHVLIMGACAESELCAAYEAADVCIFPVRDIPGDIEGFGMVAVEAASHGLPTVAFDVGGISDAVSEGQSGHLIPGGDYDAFAAQVTRVLTLGKTLAVRESCRQFAAGFEWRYFGAKLRQQLAQLISASVLKK
jgi:phosphatidylinositol alpha-1,6-mannosyltransferase